VILLEFLLTDEDRGTRNIVYRVLGTLLGMAVLLPLVLTLSPALTVGVAVVLFSSSWGDALALGEQRFVAAIVSVLRRVVVIAGLTWVHRTEQPLGH
jgi:hypothetical protein